VLFFALEEEMADIKVEGFSDPVEAIHYAQEAEKRAEARYRKIAEMTDDPGVRVLMLELAEEEKGHFNKLQDILDEFFHAEF